MTEWEKLLLRQHGVVSRRQALRFVSPTVLVRRVSAGRWQRPHRGVYITHNGPPTAHQNLWALVLAVGGRIPAVVGGLSALLLDGLRHFDSDGVHLLLPAAMQDTALPDTVVLHRTTRLPRSHLARPADPPHTSPARSVVDAARWARSDNEARAIIAVCLQQRLVVGDDVERVLAELGG